MLQVKKIFKTHMRRVEQNLQNYLKIQKFGETLVVTEADT